MEKKVITQTTYKYVLGTLKSSRYMKIEEDYLFYIQLKTYNHSSLFMKGSYLKELSSKFNLSESSISTKMNSLINKGFIKKGFKDNKHTHYHLLPYTEVYKTIFKLDDGHLMVRTVKLKSEKWLNKKELREFLDMNELINLGQKVINKDIKDNGGLKSQGLTKKDIQSTEMVQCVDNSDKPKTLNHNSFSISLIAMGKELGNKSTAYVHKLVEKLQRLGLIVKTNTKKLILPENSLDEFEMKHCPTKRYYSKFRNLFLEQQINSYFFIFNLRFMKHKCLHRNAFRIMKQSLLNNFNCFNPLSLKVS